ncbi:Multidrug and toxin extrusion protein, partial [Fasciolopsis buskii]
VLSERELAAQAIIYNIESLCYTLLPLGIGSAASIRVGHFLGAQSAIGPRSVTSVSLIVMCLLATPTIVIFATLRFRIPRIFARDENVVQTAASLFPFLAVFQFLDGIGTMKRVNPISTDPHIWSHYGIIGVDSGREPSVTTSHLKESIVQIMETELANCQVDRKKPELDRKSGSGYRTRAIRHGWHILFTITVLSFFTACLLCRLLIRWSNYFGFYCVYNNGTYLHFHSECELDRFRNASIYEANCTAVIP